MKYKQKVIVMGLLLALIMIVGTVMATRKAVAPDTINQQIDIGGPAVSQVVCYAYDVPNGRGFNDRAFLKMVIDNGVVSGEYWNFPAERDSKVGTFSDGVVLSESPNGERIADVWWTARAEGMTATEQLRISFMGTKAAALFGELVDSEDGRYVYKNPEELTRGFVMAQEDCLSYDDRFIVDKYVRDNIASLALESPVLGGRWYAQQVTTDPITKTGTVSYEDGHIQKTANFEYVRKGDSVEIRWVK